MSFGNFRRGIHVGKKRHHFSWLFLLVIGLCVAGASAQEAKYPPLSEYMIARDAEIALAKSAAPDYVSDHATIKVFTASGFQTAQEIAELPGARLIREPQAVMGPNPSVYAYPRFSTHRNIYRIPVP